MSRAVVRVVDESTPRQFLDEAGNLEIGGVSTVGNRGSDVRLIDYGGLEQDFPRSAA